MLNSIRKQFPHRHHFINFITPGVCFHNTASVICFIVFTGTAAPTAQPVTENKQQDMCQHLNIIYSHKVCVWSQRIIKMIREVIPGDDNDTGRLCSVKTEKP